jgi:hypothetical protein
MAKREKRPPHVLPVVIVVPATSSNTAPTPSFWSQLILKGATSSS